MQPGAPSTRTSQMHWTSPGDPSYTPLTEEQYGSQIERQKSYADYQNFAQMAQRHLSGMGQDVGWRRFGGGSELGHAYEAWQQFNQGQPGGPYAIPPQVQIQKTPGGPQRMGTNDVLTNPVGRPGGRPNDIMQPMSSAIQRPNAELLAGLGALKGPTQQKIQQGLGSFSQGAGI